jgi:hypothetical protein
MERELDRVLPMTAATAPATADATGAGNFCSAVPSDR